MMAEFHRAVSGSVIVHAGSFSHLNKMEVPLMLFAASVLSLLTQVKMSLIKKVYCRCSDVRPFLIALTWRFLEMSLTCNCYDNDSNGTCNKVVGLQPCARSFSWNTELN